MEIQFTNSMNFPDTDTFIKLNSDGRLLNIFMLSGDNETLEENLRSWSIQSVSPKQISVSLDFVSPLHVSQGDEPDKLVIEAKLCQYQDEDEQRLPFSVIRFKDIPLQIG